MIADSLRHEGPAGTDTVTINTVLELHIINPNIYGTSWADWIDVLPPKEALAALHPATIRFGGNDFSRFDPATEQFYVAGGITKPKRALGETMRWFTDSGAEVILQIKVTKRRDEVNLFEKVIEELLKNACPAIKYRINKEVLCKQNSFETYQPEILEDKRVQYVLSWQGSDGYFGEVFHGGWIPREERKYSATGAESALRFLSEMGFPKDNRIVSEGLNALTASGWNRGKSCWNMYDPELGLFGDDIIRAVVFAYFGMEEHESIKQEIQRAFDCLERVNRANAVSEVIEIYRGKNVHKPGFALPWSYHLKLLAFTESWKDPNNLQRLAEYIEHLIGLSPFPDIYIKYKSQLIAPAAIFPKDLKKSLKDFGDKDWFWWFHTFELFARMGIVLKVPALKNQLAELKDILNQGDGFFRIKPKDYCFAKWSVYTGLALEEDWKKTKWMYDLTFRSLLILKYSEEIS